MERGSTGEWSRVSYCKSAVEGYYKDGSTEQAQKSLGGETIGGNKFLVVQQISYWFEQQGDHAPEGNANAIYRRHR